MPAIRARRRICYGRIKAGSSRGEASGLGECRSNCRQEARDRNRASAVADPELTLTVGQLSAFCKVRLSANTGANAAEPSINIITRTAKISTLKLVCSAGGNICHKRNVSS